MNKLVLFFFCALVCIVPCAPTSIEPNSCSFLKEIIPHRILQCANKIPINCSGSTLCYKYIDSLLSTPCILAEIGLQGFMKMAKCRYDIGITVKPGLVTCIEEKYIRQFYACFNNGA